MYNNLKIVEATTKLFEDEEFYKNYLLSAGDKYKNIDKALNIYIDFIKLKEVFKGLYQKEKLSKKEMYELQTIGKKLNEMTKLIEDNAPNICSKGENACHYMVFCIFEDLMLSIELKNILGYTLPDDLVNELYEFYMHNSLDYEFNSEEVNLMFDIKIYDMFNRIYNVNGREGIARLISLNNKIKKYDVHNMMNFDYIKSGKKSADFSIISLLYRKNFVSHKFKVNNDEFVLDKILIYLTSDESFLNGIPRNKQIEVLYKIFKDHYGDLIEGKSYEDIISKFNNIASNYDGDDLLKASIDKPKVLGLGK